jgi:hypothetical protein
LRSKAGEHATQKLGTKKPNMTARTAHQLSPSRRLQNLISLYHCIQARFCTAVAAIAVGVELAHQCGVFGAHGCAAGFGIEAQRVKRFENRGGGEVLWIVRGCGAFACAPSSANRAILGGGSP